MHSLLLQKAYKKLDTKQRSALAYRNSSASFMYINVMKQEIFDLDQEWMMILSCLNIYLVKGIKRPNSCAASPMHKSFKTSWYRM